MVLHQLRFQQFEEQNPVDPGDAQFQGYAEQLLVVGAAILPQVG